MKRVLMFIGFLVLLCVPVLAQEVPGNWQDLYDNYGIFLGTYLGIAGIATFLGEYVIRLFNLTKKASKVTAVMLLADEAQLVLVGSSLTAEQPLIKVHNAPPTTVTDPVQNPAVSQVLVKESPLKVYPTAQVVEGGLES